MKFVLVHDEARRRAIDAVSQAEHGHVVTIKPAMRSLEQNAKFHAICQDMNGLPWYGKARNADDWKTLFVSGHTIATGGIADVIPGLEGDFVNIRESTAAMSKARATSLIDYAEAWRIEKGFA